jgi:hypothetical protein
MAEVRIFGIFSLEINVVEICILQKRISELCSS